MRVKSFKEAGINLGRNKQSGSIKVLCPQCSHRRLKKDDPCLSVSFDRMDTVTGQQCHLFNCHHCHFNGAVFPEGVPEGGDYAFQFDTKPKEYKLPTINLQDYGLNDKVVEWFEARGITKDTLVGMSIKSCQYPFNGEKQDAIMFPVFKGGKMINAQFRNLGGNKDKLYKSIGGCELAYVGIDDIIINGYVVTDTLYIVEGYIDRATMIQSGYPFTLTVPNGSQFEEEGQKEVSPKLEYHNDPDVQELFKRVRKVVFVGDDDHQGRRLVRELATRIGVEKCYRVKYPPDCKDINDVLVKYGPKKVIEVVENAERFPVEGVIRVSQLLDEIKTLYTTGLDTGLSTGFKNLDDKFRVGRGKVVLITGVPQSGKSRFLSNILMLMAKLHGIKFSMFAPENRPFGTYTAKMAQIYTGKRFGTPGEFDRMTEDELYEAVKWMDEHFTYNAAPTRDLEGIKRVWKQQLESEGTRYGVIDPFNYIARPGNVDEHQFILKFLTELADWGAINDFTPFVVAHPTKVQLIKSEQHPEKDGEYPVISPYNISGSSHWYNATDFILSIWRSVKPEKVDFPVDVHILKAKQEELGVSNTTAQFLYDVPTGIYTPYERFTRNEEVPFNDGEDVRPSKRKQSNWSR
jgi:twinkle protein